MVVRGIQKLSNRTVDRTANLLLGKYEAVVTNVEDPEKLGRIKAAVPSLGVVENNNYVEIDWAWPCFMPGNFSLPRVGDGVWIEFQQGVPNKPVWSGIWYANRYKKISEAPIEAQRNYRTKTITTPSGLQIVLNDENGSIKIQSYNGNIFEFDSISNANILIKRNKTEKVLGSVDESIGGNIASKIIGTINKIIGGDIVSRVVGKIVLYLMSTINIEVIQNIAGVPNPLVKTTIEADGLNLKIDVNLLGKITLGGLGAKSVVYSDILDMFTRHIHTNTGGPTGPPQDPTLGLAPMIWTGLLHATKKTKFE